MIENLGGNIARLRKAKNMSQEQLAEKVGVQKQTISNIERGARYPRFDTLEQLATYFEATPTQLFGTTQEIAISDTPAIMKQMDEYKILIQKFHSIRHFLDVVSVEDLDRTVDNIYTINKFFTPQPAWDLGQYPHDEPMPVIYEKGGQKMDPPLAESLPLDRIDDLAEKLEFIKKNIDI